MKLVKFSVENFRSIVKAQDITISNITVFVGKNNEGKSNLLKSLNIAMYCINQYANYPDSLRRLRLRRLYHNSKIINMYDWERDFPISSKSRSKKSIFILEFKLTEDEIIIFKKQFDSNLNGILPIKITIGKDNEPDIKVVKGGRGNKTLNSKSSDIIKYIDSKISFNYIPAIRTHEETHNVIDELISSELSLLERKSEYRKALKSIDNLQKPVLEKLSSHIKESLTEFLPNIQDVKVNIQGRNRIIYRRRGFDVEIDDGVPTSIEYKGDGVQSLVALGLLKNKSYKRNASIVAIEEPESHLHSGAIHQLQKIIESLRDESQIILSTHNPLFVNRQSISSNIIVEKGKAEEAKSIKEIRDILGVRVSDNLVSSSHVLVVEGSNDEKSLKAILSYHSSKIEKALKNHKLTMWCLYGASNLLYELSVLRNQMCKYYVFLDYDEASCKRKDKAIKEGLLYEKHLIQTICKGINESEFEDCISVDIYQKEISSKYDVNLNTSKKFRNNQQKWSLRIQDAFRQEGKDFNDKVKKEIKTIVSECIEKNPKEALCKHKGSSIMALCSSLENFLSN